MTRAGLVLGVSALLLAGCASRPAPAPAPQPAAPVVQAPQPAPPPVPVPPPADLDWADRPLTPGQWLYSEESGGGAMARFAAADGSGFAIRCDRAAGRLVVTREGVPAGAMTIRTTSVARSFPAPSAALPAGDPLLDAMAFSRGRFSVEGAGRMMILPAWPEPGRIAEDCRS